MLVILPLISLISLFWLIWQVNNHWRNSVLSAAIVWGLIVAISTELLSIFKAINFTTIFLLWFFVDLFVIYLILKRQKKSLQLIKLAPLSWVLLGGIFFIITVIGIIALVAPPNNADSMTYHMSRVVHWIQNGSIAHYPTYFSGQLVWPPFAELSIMHLQILSDSDRYANLVHYFSMIGSVLGVSLIAKQLGAKEQGQIFAALFAVTIPMGILQSSSTQNDYVVTFWIVCLAHSTLSIVLTSNKAKIPDYLLYQFAASMGLAVFTKSSSYFFTLPFFIWLSITYFKRLKWQSWRQITFVLSFVLLINIKHYLRNFALYGNPLSVAEYSVGYRIEVYSIPAFISNIIRNLSFHTDIVGYLQLDHFIKPTYVNDKIYKVIIFIHHFLGIDPSDTRTTDPLYHYSVPSISTGENTANNPLHFLLILVSIFLIILFKKLRQNSILCGYLYSIIGGFLLFCLLTKMQLYHSRHHLVLFVLSAGFVGLVFSKIFNKYWLVSISIVLFMTCLPWVFDHKTRSITGSQNIFNVSRDEQYFMAVPQLKAPYIEAVDFIKKQNCSNIGLSLGSEALPYGYWEYPFWILLKERLTPEPLRIEHILNPNNTSNKLSQFSPFNNFVPCAIIAIRESKEEKIEEMTVKGHNYSRKWKSDPLNVLLRQ